MGIFDLFKPLAVVDEPVSEPDLTPIEASAEPINPPLAEARPPDLHPDPLIRGQRAELLLNDPMLRAAFEAARDKYRREWEAASITDLDTQRAAHLKFNALRDVLKEINQHITSAGFVKARNDAAAKREQAQHRASNST